MLAGVRGRRQEAYDTSHVTAVADPSHWRCTNDSATASAIGAPAPGPQCAFPSTRVALSCHMVQVRMAWRALPEHGRVDVQVNGA
jgi:hypothetical protein